MGQKSVSGSHERVLVAVPAVGSGAPAAPIAGLSNETTPVLVSPFVSFVASSEALGAAAVAHVSKSAEIVDFPSDLTRHYRLAARIASVHALNPPKALAPPKARIQSTTKPLPKLAPVAMSGNSLKTRRSLAAPRVLRPARVSADVVRLVQPAFADAGAGPAQAPDRFAASR